MKMLWVVPLLLAGCAWVAEPDHRSNGDGTPVIRMSAPKAGIATNMHLIGRNGDVETWESQNGVQIALRKGLVVATRGLGFDLMSAEQSHQKGRYTRRISLPDGDFGLQFLTLNCVATATTDRRVETCHGSAGVISNIITFGRDGAMTRSRQWVSPKIGYIYIRHGP